MGEVTGVNTAPLLECIAQGRTPVISPTALGEDGKIYNCNADVAAAQAAIALKAKRLVFMSDVPGLMRDPKDPATVIRAFADGEVEGLKKSGIIDKGMIPKVDSAVAAHQERAWKKFRLWTAGCRTRCCWKYLRTRASAQKSSFRKKL